MRQAHTKLIISENIRFQHSRDNNRKGIFFPLSRASLQDCRHTCANTAHGTHARTPAQRQRRKGPFCLLNADEKLPTANFNHVGKMSRRHAATPTVSLKLSVAPLEFGESGGGRGDCPRPSSALPRSLELDPEELWSLSCAELSDTIIMKLYDNKFCFAPR